MVDEQVQEGVPASDTAMAAAMAILGNASVDAQEAPGGDEAPEVVPAPTERQTEPVEPVEESRVDLWARLTERDKEIRRLKQAAKGGDMRELAKSDPAKALAELGIGLEQALDILAAQAGAAPQPSQDGEIGALRKEIEQLRSMQTEREQRDAMRAELASIAATVEKGGDRWELVHALQAHEQVLQHASAYYQDHGIVPKYEDVLDVVEEALEQEATAELERLSKISKLKGKLNIGEATKAVAQPTAAAPTLSNAISPPSPRRMTEEERMARAMALLDKEK